MLFRLISDLHVDVNEKNPLYISDDAHKETSGKNIFTLIAGDISGDPITDAYWLKRNTECRGAFITGNHIVYNERGKAIQDLQNELKTIYPNDGKGRYTYLEKDKIVFEDEKIVLIGATLWTDYLVGHPDQRWNMGMAKRCMNDFRFGRIKNENGEIEPLSPEWCAMEHEKTLQYINYVCRDYKDYKIIVMSHHCPSIQSISMRFSGHSCNGAYVSDLDEFIKGHENIKVWVCGHVHNPHSYDIGQCHVMANPRGYCGYYEDNHWSYNNYIFELTDNGITFPIQMSKEDEVSVFEKLDNNF